MLPGNLQYWQPCKWTNERRYEKKGTIGYNINEPIHFCGPSPGDQSAIAEEEKKEQPMTSVLNQPPETDQDDPHGAAQQRPPDDMTPQVPRPIKEETKDPEPPQTVMPAGGAAMSAPSVDAPPRVDQQPIQSVQP